jgi:hypothetical protein
LCKAHLEFIYSFVAEPGVEFSNDYIEIIIDYIATILKWHTEVARLLTGNKTRESISAGAWKLLSR